MISFSIDDYKTSLLFVEQHRLEEICYFIIPAIVERFLFLNILYLLPAAYDRFDLTFRVITAHVCAKL